MEVSYRADRLIRAVCYIRRGDLVRPACGSVAPDTLIYAITPNREWMRNDEP